jgi:hypothetical protein
VVGSVREPCDWYVSMWHWLIAGKTDETFEKGPDGLGRYKKKPDAAVPAPPRASAPQPGAGGARRLFDIGSIRKKSYEETISMIHSGEALRSFVRESNGTMPTRYAFISHAPLGVGGRSADGQWIPNVDCWIDASAIEGGAPHLQPRVGSLSDATPARPRSHPPPPPPLRPPHASRFAQTLEHCLRAYEAQGGRVEWSSTLLRVALDVAGGGAAADGAAAVNSSGEPLADLPSKDLPPTHDRRQGLPWNREHCGHYFDRETAELVQRANAPLYEAFGWKGCCDAGRERAHQRGDLSQVLRVD